MCTSCHGRLWYHFMSAFHRWATSHVHDTIYRSIPKKMTSLHFQKLHFTFSEVKFLRMKWLRSCLTTLFHSSLFCTTRQFKYMEVLFFNHWRQNTSTSLHLSQWKHPLPTGKSCHKQKEITSQFRFDVLNYLLEPILIWHKGWILIYIYIYILLFFTAVYLFCFSFNWFYRKSLRNT